MPGAPGRERAIVRRRSRCRHAFCLEVVGDSGVLADDHSMDLVGAASASASGGRPREGVKQGRPGPRRTVAAGGAALRPSGWTWARRCCPGRRVVEPRRPTLVRTILIEQVL